MTGQARSERGREHPTGSAPPPHDAVVWHDVECAGYTADLEVWRELARGAGDPVLELGAGTGRVALDLAAGGHRVEAVDSDPALVQELGRRARERGLPVRAHTGDVRSLDLGRRFAAILAPMQVVQLLGGARGRGAMLEAARGHLEPGGVLALALADPFEEAPAEDALPPLPDVRELDGCVYSSRPVAMTVEGEAVAIHRIREAVSPDGSLQESAVTLLLDTVSADRVAAEAGEAGFRERPRRRVPPTDAYVGSDVVVLEST